MNYSFAFLSHLLTKLHFKCTTARNKELVFSPEGARSAPRTAPRTDARSADSSGNLEVWSESSSLHCETHDDTVISPPLDSPDACVLLLTPPSHTPPPPPPRRQLLESGQPRFKYGHSGEGVCVRDSSVSGKSGSLHYRLPHCGVKA